MSRQNRKNRSLSFVAMTALSMAMFGPSGSAALADDKVPSNTPPLTPPAPASTTSDDKALSLAHDLSRAFQKVAKDVTPAIVHITATKGAPVRGRGISPGMDPFESFFGRQRPPETSYGSGIIVSSDGYILTNNHVIENAQRINVALGDSRSFEARLIGRDPETDVAVLRIEGEQLPTARLGDSENVEVGEWVLAIGNPFGLNQTVTAGIISAKNRRLNGPARGQARIEDFFQTDAAINPGNSGGALINLKGEVIGMNTAIFSRSGGYMGLGFAIPANLARGVMDSLINTGTVQRGWLGVGIQNLTPDVAQSAGYTGTDGAFVNMVQDNSPALAAGLKKGDIILAVNSKPVDSDDTLRSYIAGLVPGKDVKLDIFRDGKRTQLNAKIGKLDESRMKADAGEITSDNRLGLAAANLIPEFADKYRLPSALKGVIVTDIRDDSAAAGFLNPGDVITAIDNKAIRSTEEFKAQLDRLNFRRGVNIAFWSQGVQRNLMLRDANR